MFPYRRSSTVVLGLLLIDLPVLIAVAVAGAFYGYARTYEAVTAWRLQHPWSLIPSVVLAVVLVVRWRRAR